MTKLVIAFSFIWSFQALGNDTSGQNITLDLENVSIETVLRAIESQGAYRFVYKNEVLSETGPVSVSVRNADLDEVLDRLLHNTSLFYRLMSNDLVVIADSDPMSDTDVVLQDLISGVIRDEEGNPVPGAGIMEKGTTNGATSADDGSFSLNTLAENAVLVITSIGYTPREIAVSGDQTGLTVVLVRTSDRLEEVVVVGYGVQKKANLTGAVSSIDFEKQSMTSRAISNVSSAMAGLASGIRVRQSNGLPSGNNDADLTIRGLGSLNISSAPLVIVDGQIASIGSVSPNDVASVSILKDAASAAIYGSRASNGVILITTKTGKGMNGKVSFTYNNYVGLKEPTMLPDWAYNTVDHMRLINMALENSGSDPWYSEEYISEWREGIRTDPIAYPSTNWWEAITKRNVIQNHNLSARGGNDKVNFYTSMDYYHDDGMIPNTAFGRLNFRNNLTYNVNKWFRLGNNVTYSASQSDPVAINDIFRYFLANSPATVPQHPDGRYGGPQLLNEAGDNNPLKTAQTERGETRGNRFQGKIFGVIEPLSGLSVTASYFADIYQQLVWGGSEPTDLWNFQTNEIMDKNEGTPRVLRNSFQKFSRQVVDVYADYTKTFGRHHGHLLAGYNQEYYKSSNFSGARQDLLSYETPVFNAATGEITNLGGNASDYALRSFFGRLNYDFDGKYLLEANLRYDGSSRFAPEKRWGLFPSASIGWIISREDFFEPLTTVLTNLKIRASYGELGNNGIGNYDWQNFYSVVKYPFNEVATSGLIYTSFGNPFITWESTAVANVGIDTRLADKLDLTLNYYDKMTQSILTNLPIPSTNGGISAPLVNSAKVHNAGFEAEAQYRQRFGKLHVSAALNFSYNKNRIVSYKGDFIEPHGQNAAAWTEGQPIGIFWVREVDHIIQTEEALDDLKEGEVYICTGASPSYALWGGLMSTRALYSGAAGAVVDGYSRDTNEILALNFPTFGIGSYAQDQGPRGKVVDFRIPIEFGGITIRPGDLIFGDLDGVVVVPRELEKEVFRGAIEKARGEKIVRKALEQGMRSVEAFTKYGIM